jgi:hypothetical protein
MIERPFFLAAFAACVIAAATPSAAGAFARIGPAPIPGSPGLPDGRVYEQVSPTNKNGNPAGTPGDGSVPTIVAEAGGEGAAYNVLGSVGETKNGFQLMAVAKRGAEGWKSYGAQPRAIGPQAALLLQPHQFGFSADLTKDVFYSDDTYLPETPVNALIRYHIPTGELAWLDPPPASPEVETNDEPIVAGFSADMSTFYFRMQTGVLGTTPLYEWHNGVESLAGVLPNGNAEPHVAVAGSGAVQERLWTGTSRNQVSEDGSRAFFVSLGARAPQLYVRETAADGTQRTVLVSRDTQLEPVAGEPVPAPQGVVRIAFPAENFEGGVGSGGEDVLGKRPPFGEGYAYAAPDGSRVFFSSEDPLTPGAPSSGGMYEFSTRTESLTYLPGVGASPILASSHDGTRFLFNGPTGVSVWSEEGASGGTVTQIEPLPVGGEARATPDGSVFVFESAGAFPGFNNGGSHVGLENGGGPFANQEIYRYDVAENAITCVSCPPAGVTPSGNAYMTHDVPGSILRHGLLFGSEGRGVSIDGSRVFFDSPDPLVPQDANTAPPLHTPTEEVKYHERGRDVYEWENGKVYLISTGTSSQPSYLGDASANGNDVFFSTAQGIAPGDTDESYDVYDARVPRPGDRPPPPPAPCEGDVCQGPPSVYSLLGAPASATFNGLGNPPPSLPAATPARAKPAAKATRCGKGFAKRHGKCVRKRARGGSRSPSAQTRGRR